MPIIPFILTYWKQICYGIAALTLLASVFYVKHVFSQNEARRIALIEKDSQIANLKAGFEAYLQFNREVQEAVDKVRKEFAHNVTIIENSPRPLNGTKFVFMSATSLRTSPSFTYRGYSGHPAGNR